LLLPELISRPFLRGGWGRGSSPRVPPLQRGELKKLGRVGEGWQEGFI